MQNTRPVNISFVIVVLIWATTPVTIKWSSEGAGFLLAVMLRMLIGTIICLFIISIRKRRLRRDQQALQTYLAAGAGIWLGMTSIFWGIQFISSGMVSVIFGLTPIVTGIFAVLLLGEKVFTPFKILGMALGLIGLGIIFRHSMIADVSITLGVMATLFAVTAQSFSAVWVKRINAGTSGFDTTTGGLLVSLPLFVIGWAIWGGVIPEQLEPKAIASIIYLGVFGSVIAFILYFRLIHQWPASRISLITLLTPVVALLIGKYANAEIVGMAEWVGVVLILIALVSFEYGDQWKSRIRKL